MKRKGIHERKNRANLDVKDKTSALNSRGKKLPTIKCTCGAEILVMPDLDAMNQAIQNHMAKHKKTNRPSAEGTEEESILEQFLVEQLLRIAGRLGRR